MFLVEIQGTNFNQSISNIKLVVISTTVTLNKSFWKLPVISSKNRYQVIYYSLVSSDLLSLRFRCVPRYVLNRLIKICYLTLVSVL